MSRGRNTLIQVPADIKDPVALRRFLEKVIEQLDVVSGVRKPENSTELNLIDLDERITKLENP
jgi:hypothetical protein